MSAQHNHTPFTIAEITAMPLMFTVQNNWRQRNVTVYEHPSDAGKVVSVGISFDQRMVVIAEETREEWARQIEELPWQQHFVLN